jgi:hypothetical protein
MNPESNMVYGILSWETWREYLVLGVGRSNNYRIPHPRGKLPGETRLCRTPSNPLSHVDKEVP